MCKQRGNAFCSELGADSESWSRQTPLPKPDYFEELWMYFVEALTYETQGDYESSRKILKEHDGRQIGMWFDIHAQNAGEWRRKAFNLPTTTPSLPLDPVKVFEKYLPTILSRDNFRCRYCSRTVLPKKKLISFHRNLGDEFFPIGRRNSEISGYYLVLCATLDHVIPHSLGGRTNEGNLVTSCWPCNYGKMNNTLEQIGLENPFSRDPLPLEIPLEILMSK